ncbi:sushi, von Willebrand factor type A, EGF and pentraxin domain-containing protein 1 isoform X1 [Lingula anatina]|uniref:Sushi, von Willebrand factor type A, EGF and pentraxin domain-containing protein 1 isoform X1 n=1 Tax=Lingula anatina TaxID=7574 RepID=A0A1S3IF85_LINAN|nr:sushi, von Willebrand factor type A, EGF and pentraxin domain-containing protein 1 isoform X1 [Lingula anatina]|eukprot:XP_013396516.1 sushi, von Willebrand factor type A, EGF and pentraxin domain-containing protein 1 isoform X1 [Lingula anatina]
MAPRLSLAVFILVALAAASQATEEKQFAGEKEIDLKGEKGDVALDDLFHDVDGDKSSQDPGRLVKSLHPNHRMKRGFLGGIGKAVGGLLKGVVSIGGLLLGRGKAEKAATNWDPRMYQFQLEQLCHSICVTEWTDWSACSNRCGGGTRTRTREQQTIGRCAELQNFQCAKKLEATSRCNEDCANGGRGDGSGNCACLVGWKGQCCDEEIVCPHPLKPENGRVTGTWPARVRSVASFTCNEGYHLAGRDSITCQPDGTWNGEPPKCSRVVCTMPAAKDHVEILNVQEKYAFDDQLVYRCQEGYQMVGAAIRTCQLDQGDTGKWSGIDPICDPISCGDPGVPSHGQRDGTAFYFNDVVTFTCQTGYKLEGADRRKCMATGTWSGSTPVCKEIKCDAPRRPKNGEIIGSRYTFGSIVTFECDAGHVIQGSHAVKCLETGFWNATEPRCQAASCGNPGQPANGAKDGSVYYYPSNITYSCFHGYVLVGTKSIKCKADGKWSGSVPTCEACPVNTYMPSGSKTCSPCPANTHTLTEASTSQDQCVCDDGYSGPAGGPCQEVKCPPLSQPDHGTSSACGDRPGDVCEFRCDDGYIMEKGSAMRTCQGNGQWDGTDATCAPCLQNTYKSDERSCLPCPVHSHTDGVANMKSGCTCDAGYTGNAGGPCTDIDECAPNGGRGPCDDVCDNNDGGYKCSCSIQGYGISPENKHVCVVEQQCRNLTTEDAPLNGGLVCHWYREQNSQQCSVKCNKDYEFPSRINDYESCGPSTGFIWSHQQEDPENTFKPCLEQFFPDFRLEAESAYFVRACNDLTPEERLAVRQEFADKLTAEGICLKRTTKVCDVANVDIICGRTTRRRRRRGVDEVVESVDFSFNLTAKKMFNETKDCDKICQFLRIPDAFCSELCFPTFRRFMRATMLYAKRQLTQKFSNEKNRMKFMAARREFEPDDVKTSDVVVACEEGMRAANETCVPCQPGTYLDKGVNDCLPCSSGQFQPLERQLQCLPCPVGTTTKSPGARMCSVCPDGSYGDNCQETCDCVNGRCDPRDGSCLCHSGWEGARCEVDVPGCREGSCYQGVQCIDIPAPGLGFRCESCPPGMLGDGASCRAGSS